MKKLTFLFFIITMSLMAVPQVGSAANDLQQMIDLLEDGDRLQLENKTYEGNITIDKSIEVIGQKNTVIKGNGTGNVISIHAPNVTIRNIAVTGGSMNRNSSEEYAGIKLYSDHNVIDGVIIKHSFHGIYLSQSHHNIIENSQVTGVGKGEIAGQGNGLHIYYSNDNLLKNNIVKGSRDGMFFDYANENEIVDNTISNTRYGLHYMYSDDNFFKGNTFTMNTGGAAIMHSNGIRLEKNRFIFNFGHKSFGLLLLSSRDTTILDNTFSLNQRGLYIDQATGSVIKHNQILKNQIGIELWASSNEQIFSLNEIEENTIPVASLGGEGRNSWSENGIGNHWGKSFPMLDLNQDGIGDESIVYQSSLHELIEDQELVYLFLKSPAIAIYEKMNQFFHKEKTMFTDPYPIVQEHESKMSWVILVGALLIAAYLYQKKKLL